MISLKRIISILLLCTMCVSMLASCSEPKSNDKLTTGGAETDVESVADTEEVTEAEYVPEEWNFETLFTFDENEKPLDRMVTDGGLCSIFQTVAVIGDSMAAGQFEQDPTLSGQYPDTYPYSWAAHMERDCGFKVYNFSRGGLTAKEYVETYADQGSNQFFNGRYRAQAYIIAFGINDKHNGQPIGTVADINEEDYNKNADSYTGSMAKIIQRYKEISPDAFFFLVTKPRYAEVETTQAYIDQREAIYALSEFFNQTYVIDLFEYAPIYDEEFQERFFLRGHMNPMGYRFSAILIESYIDYYIRKDPAAFYEVGFMNTNFYTLGDKAKK